MNDTTKLPEWLQHPFRLNQEEIADSRIVIDNFIHSRSLHDHRELIWSILEAALAGTKDNYTSSDEVFAWVLYCRSLEKLIEAIYLSHG